MEEKKVLIDARNLVKTYGEGEALTYALNDVSIKVYEHDFLVILGGSGSVIAVPASAGFTIMLLNLASSSSQIYPFIFSWPVVLMALGFVALVMVICHLLAMFSIRKWNIANNTRTRE